MATRTSVAATAILGLMFASLLVIYVVVPQNGNVTFLSVFIMAIGLVVAFVGDRDDIMMMAGLSALVSLVAAYFLGQSMFGNVGATLIALAWGVALLLMASRASAETVVIPEDHAFMVAPFLSGQAYAVSSSLPVTSLPFLDRHVATIPTYELVTDVPVTKVNIKAGVHDVDKIEVHTRYQVTVPEKTLRGIPNRGQIQSEIAKDMGGNVQLARQNVAFWERLLAKQMQDEVDDIVRKVVFNAPGIDNLKAAYLNRVALSEQVQQQLQALVDRWGVRIREVSLDFYVLDKELLKSLNAKERAQNERDRELQRANDISTSAANHIRLTGVAQAERIRAILDQVQNVHPELTSADVAEIVTADLLSRGCDDETDIEQVLKAKPPEPPKPPAGGPPKP